MKTTPEIPQLPDGCGYTGHDFGASYPDSQCFGGQLYDLDNSDEPGTINEPLNYIPCPECQHEEWLERQVDEIRDEGYMAAYEGKTRDACPFPAAATRYPQDGEWYRLRWMEGYEECEKEKECMKNQQGEKVSNSCQQKG